MSQLSQCCTELFEYIFSRGLNQEPRIMMNLSYMNEFSKISKLKVNRVKIIHIAGSKGKGSVAVQVASGLHACGYKVGLYTSPHVTHWYERIKIMGSEMNEKELLRIGKYLQKIVKVQKRENRYNFFEWLTVLAIHYFIQQKCDFVVLETGLGGKYDSTNIFKPVATAITLIEKEHCEILGDTLEEISRQKCGIIKKGVPNFSYFQKKIVKKEISHQCSVVKTSNVFIESSIKEFVSNSFDHSTIFNGKRIEYSTALFGKHQGYNAILALQILKNVLKKKYIRQESAILKSLSSAFLPGRFQIISQKPWIIVDCAHTAESVKASLITLKTIVKESEISVLFGCAEHKNVNSMMESLKEITQKIYITKPGEFKKSNLDNIEMAAKNINFECIRIDDTKMACNYFLGIKCQVYFVIGSFFLVDIFLQEYKKIGGVI